MTQLAPGIVSMDATGNGLTTNPLLIGNAPHTFASADEVGAFFGASALETALATMAFRDGVARVTFDLAEALPPDPAAYDPKPYQDAAQAYLDRTAQERLYDSIFTLCTYQADDLNPVFAAEGATGRAFRSAVWTKGYEVMAQVEGGQIPIPTVDDFLAMLPTIAWPPVLNSEG
jgi:hypothetical protein